jgi:hypothetical protein
MGDLRLNHDQLYTRAHDGCAKWSKSSVTVLLIATFHEMGRKDLPTDDMIDEVTENLNAVVAEVVADNLEVADEEAT